VKALIQRVSKASVTVGGEMVGEIGPGLAVLIGVAGGDTEKDAEYIISKTVNLRIFRDDQDKFNLSALDTKGELLLISQFTLLADARKGRRPSFEGAAAPEAAEKLFNYCLKLASETGLKAATGRFQQYMQVEIHNDGPVTILLDSKEKFGRQ
jgi:D-tyrosyl-tRNA(Tyr) deacylase